MRQDSDRLRGDEETLQSDGDSSTRRSDRPQSWGDDGVLEITWEDLGDTDTPAMETASARGKQYPAVDKDMLEQGKAAGEVQTYVLCSQTGKPFNVSWHQSSPGVYDVARVEPFVLEQGPAGSSLTQIPGTFRLGQFPGCPHCGCPRLSVCEMCQSTICEGAARSSFLGKRTVQCPNCGNRGELYGQADAAYGQMGGKGKKGKDV